MKFKSKKNSVDTGAGAARRRSIESGPQVGSNPFKRGAAFTGSSSADISSVSARAESEAAILSPRARAHVLAKKRRKLRLALSLLVIIIGLAGFLLQQYTASGSFQAIGQPSDALSSRYRTTLEKYYASRPVERFRFALSQDTFAAFMKRSHPEINTIDVDGSSSIGVSRFVVSLRQPVAVWSIGDSLRFVDANGISFSENYFDTPSVKIVDSYGADQLGGLALTSNRFLGIVGQVVGLSKQAGITIERVEIPPTTTRQIAVYPKNHPYPVRMTIDRPVEAQVSDMARTLRWMDANYPKPAYIDVRVPGRAFYR